MQLTEKIAHIYRTTYGRWSLHVLFWILMFLARCYITTISFNPVSSYPTGIVVSSLLATLNIALVYYLLAYIIYPRWLKKRQFLTGAGGIVLVVIVYTWLDYLTELFLLRDPVWKALMAARSGEYYAFLQRGLVNVLFSRILTLGILYQLFPGLALPVCIKVMLAYMQAQVEKADLARRNLQLEFDFLRSQVNPHFLFNTLNNIYSLILHDQKQRSADMVAGLSAFMRYSLHASEMDAGPADKEIGLMKDYIALEEVRLNHARVTSHFEEDGAGYRLPPLLLIPLLENAFKYCADKEGACLDIRLSLTQGTLCFSCSNTVDAARLSMGAGGIGIVNTVRRLREHYGQRYIYDVKQDKDEYLVTLTIQRV